MTILEVSFPYLCKVNSSLSQKLQKAELLDELFNIMLGRSANNADQAVGLYSN